MDITEEEKRVLIDKLREGYVTGYKGYMNSGSFEEKRDSLYDATTSIGKIVKILENERPDSQFLEKFPLHGMKATLNSRMEDYNELIGD